MAQLEALGSRTEFRDRVSHELHTPLNCIIGMATLLTDSALDSSQREFAEAVKSSGEALANVVDEILDFWALEAGEA